MAQNDLHALLEYLAKSIVNNPDDVYVEEYVNGKVVHLDLQVHPRRYRTCDRQTRSCRQLNARDPESRGCPKWQTGRNGCG